MGAGEAAEQLEPIEPQKRRAREVKPWDGRFRVYLYVFEGPGEEKLATSYLEAREKDEPNVYARDVVLNGKKQKRARWTNELRLDKMRENWLIIPIVRDQNRDYSESVEVANRFKTVEHKAPVEEREAIEVGHFLKAAESDDGDDDLHQSDLVNHIAKLSLPAAPRIQRRGDGKGNHVNWLTLRWG